MERLISKYIFDPEMTAGKMIFLTGPRQVGKTTFAQKWLESGGSEDTYFNWDDPSLIAEYKKNPLYFRNIIDEKFKGSPVPLVFDEIHKHMEWRNILKGFYDINREKMQLLVTGSARLGYFQKSGDSLVGRYFSYQLFPLGLAEALGDFSYILDDGDIFADANLFAGRAREVKIQEADETLENLLKFGGFPEPFLKGTEKFHRRWQNDYKNLLTKEDVRDLSRIADIKGLETLVEILPTKVGSQLSIPSLSEDLGKRYDTIKNWIDILHGLYLVFTLRPWHKKIARAIKKEKKLYFLDWSLLSESGVVFENLIAVSLIRMAARMTEIGQGNFEIQYIRDREKREVDFVLVKDNQPVCLFEAKESDTDISKPGRFFGEKLNIPLYQIVRNAEKVEAFPGNCIVIPASNFLMLTG
ncbi:MAG: ATP-binding protein [Desulfobacterales bacterium]|nr:ATP-binding protein [Desulfobacterales bacterium]